MRSGEAFGLPWSCDWSMTYFFNLMSAIGQSTLKNTYFGGFVGKEVVNLFQPLRDLVPSC